MDNGAGGGSGGNPLVVWGYGIPKRGKSGSMAALRPGALFFGVKPAIDLVTQGTYGFEAAVWPESPQNFDDIFRILDDNADIVSSYDGWVFDDLTHICEMSLGRWDAAPEATSRGGKHNVFYQYVALNKASGELVARARHASVPFVGFTSHEKEPGYDDDGNFHPGGPDIGTKARAKKMPGWCDIACRFLLDEASPDPWLKTKIFVNPFDKQWTTGDRHDICWTDTPPNLREILRASDYSYDLPRIPGLEWQDEVADEVAAKMAAGETAVAVAKAVAASRSAWLCTDRRHEKWLRWAVQDGIARYRLQLRLAAGLFSDDRLAPVTGRAGRKAPPPPPPPASPTSTEAKASAVASSPRLRPQPPRPRPHP